MSRIVCLWMVCFLMIAPALAQEAPGEGTSDEVAPALTETEKKVQALVEEGGVVVVRFWAPWCHNSMSELRRGFWPEVIAEHEDVTFVFVTIFHDGKTNEDTLRDFNIPERVHVFAQPDEGPSIIHANRRKTFLHTPIVWTPTTWIFRNGRLIYGLNYGEVGPELLNLLLDGAQEDWSRH